MDLTVGTGHRPQPTCHILGKPGIGLVELLPTAAALPGFQNGEGSLNVALVVLLIGDCLNLFKVFSFVIQAMFQAPDREDNVPESFVVTNHHFSGNSHRLLHGHA